MLSTGAEISGRVLTADGKPLKHAFVEVKGKVLAGIPQPTKEGRYHVGTLRAGPYTVTAKADGYESAQKQVELTAGQKLSNLDFRLEYQGFGSVSGKVRLPDGSPADGATVSFIIKSSGGFLGDSVSVSGLIPTGVDTNSNVKAFKTTDTTGVFSVNNLPAGTYTMFVSAPGFPDISKQDIEIKAGQSVKKLDVQLQRGGNIRGRVIVPEGEPFPEKMLVVAGPVGISNGRIQVILDPIMALGQHSVKPSLKDGRFIFKNLLPGEYEVITYGEERIVPPDPIKVQVESDKMVEVELVLPRPGLIAGKVVRADTKEPVVGAEVSATGKHVRFFRQARTAHDGTYKIKFLRAGKHEVRCMSDGLAQALIHDVEVHEGKTTTEIDFALYEGGTVSGRIIVPGKMREKYKEMHIVMSGNSWVEGRPDAEGNYKIERRILPGVHKFQLFLGWGKEKRMLKELSVEVKDKEELTGINFEVKSN